MQQPELFAHPFSSYSQKVMIALYENATPFSLRLLDGSAEAMAELSARWPLKRFPILVDVDETVMESSIIIEYLQQAYPGPVQLIPSAPKAALQVRLLDRFFDTYVMGPMQTIVHNQLRPEAQRDPTGVATARAMLETAYQWLEDRLATAQTTWVAGDDFSLADCAAAPSLLYADWVCEIDDRRFATLRAYRTRLLGRPSYARCLDEARPFRGYFPLPVPDRD
jgi:glutathione S-transferase